jgi:two-component system, LuxR family, response regulator FixJ
MKGTAGQQGTVFIVDDDQAIRQGMHYLMRSVGLPAEIYSSADDFLKQFDAGRGGCLVLDIRMPGLGGLELRDRLLAIGSSIPIIFMTGHGDVPMAVEAMQKGAFDFVQKPFRDQDLLDRVTRALSTDEHGREERLRLSALKARHETLTKREREVMELVVTGKPNKTIAYELGTSQRTVEIHRARVMDKMQARSLAALVRMFLQLQSGDKR